MADVELVIKISEKVYNALTHIEFDANLVTDEMRKSIANGAPLPKGHGRIIDESQITQVRYHDYISKVDGWQIPHCFIDGTDAPTIIEADKTESEEV